MQGKIKWYNYQKGYGFILGDDEEQYFLHRSQVNESMNLKENMRVEFTPTATEKGKQATGLSIIGEDNV